MILRSINNTKDYKSDYYMGPNFEIYNYQETDPRES